MNKSIDILGEESSYTTMSPKEKEYFIELLKEEIEKRKSDAKFEQIRDIIPIEEWINSPYHVGPDYDRIYSYWKDVIVDVFDGNRTIDNKINLLLLSGSIGIGKSCLSETTRIPTTLGLLPLKTLYKEFHENGKRFKVMSESGLRECTDVYDNGVDDTKIIKFKSGREVEGTSKHKIRVIRNGNIEWVKFGDLRVGDRTLMKLDEHPFGNLHMNPDEAYTIGYMVGDGWCEHSGAMYSKNKFSSFQVMFQYENTEVARKICQAYYNWFGRKGLKHRVEKVSNGNHMVYLRAFNAERATKLVNSGFGSGARNKGVPSFIFRCDKETVSNFIQGLFDSDGTAEKGGFTYITMMSKECIYDLGRLISMFGIDYQIKEKDSFFGGRYMGKCYQLAIMGTDSYIKFEEEIGFNIDYKSQRLREKIERSLGGNNRNNRIIVPDGVKVLRELDNEDSLGNKRELHNFTQFRTQDNYTLLQLRKLYDIKEDWVSKSDYLKYICENDVGFDEIVEISDGRCHTYDLTVDNDHSYCFNGFISHNTCAELVVLRKLYEMSCYRNINAMYNLMRQASIMFFYFSVNKTQAERTGFGAIRNLIDSVPYFNEYFKRKDRIDSLLVFPENIQIAFGSGSNDMIGMNSITSILDEANFIGGRDVGNVEKASALFTSIVNRSNSRFIINGGENHSLNILVSSATTENSVTELVMGQNRDNPHAYICAPAQWEVKPDKFSKKYFFVCKGTEHLEPHVVHSTDDINNFRLAEGVPKEKFVDNLTEFDDIDREIQKLPPHLQSKFLKVPEDLRTGFETNIIRSLQDMGGVSTGSTGKLFTSMSVYKDCIDERFVHPFTANEIVLSTGDTIQIKDYLRTSFRLKHPERPRFIHIDQSYRTDSTGITCGYVDNVIVDEQTGMKKPVIGVDFMLRINPPSPPRKIAIYKIRNFIVWLGTAFGMKIGKVTYDIFNSEESRQILEEMGFNVGYQSVDRTDKAYLDLVEIMYEGRFKTYDYPIFKYELFNLVHYRDKRKVDHLKTISNDASAINGSGGYSGKGCLLGDTSIKLLNGTKVPIKDLVGKEDIYLYGCTSSGKFVPVKAKCIWETKRVTTICEVTLDNGEIIRCTPDHRFMLRDGSYEQAQNLKEGQSLMPLYVRYDGKFCPGYEMIVCNDTGIKKYTHTLVFEHFAGRKQKKGNVIHHYDINKYNNTPDNLIEMLREDHTRLHAYLSGLGKNVEKRANTLKKRNRKEWGLPENFPIQFYEYDAIKKSLEDYLGDLSSYSPWDILDLYDMYISDREFLKRQASTFSKKARKLSNLPEDFPLPPWKFREILNRYYFTDDDRSIAYSNPYYILEKYQRKTLLVSLCRLLRKRIDYVYSKNYKDKRLYARRKAMIDSLTCKCKRSKKKPCINNSGENSTHTNRDLKIGESITKKKIKVDRRVNVKKQLSNDEKLELRRDRTRNTAYYKYYMSLQYISNRLKKVIREYPEILRNDKFIKIVIKSRYLRYKRYTAVRNNTYVNMLPYVKENGRRLNEVYWKSEEGRKRKEELVKTQLCEARKTRMDREDAEWIQGVDPNIPIISICQATRLYGGGSTAAERRLKKMGIDFIQNALELRDASEDYLKSISLSRRLVDKVLSTYNHKVIKVELVNLDEEVPVYDIEVPETHNFALSAGVYVHNSGQGSKDVSDSVAGMVENILQFSIAEESGGYQNNIDDFLYVNKLNGDFEFDAMSAEDLIDKQIDNMIEEFEYSGDITTGGYIDGTQSWF